MNKKFYAYAFTIIILLSIVFGACVVSLILGHITHIAPIIIVMVDDVIVLSMTILGTLITILEDVERKPYEIGQKVIVIINKKTMKTKEGTVIGRDLKIPMTYAVSFEDDPEPKFVKEEDIWRRKEVCQTC